MSTIQFTATVSQIGSQTLIRLPSAASLQLPSRGMTMVKGTINNVSFQAPLEPDGQKGHWLKLDDRLSKVGTLSIGDKAVLDIEPTKDWPEPTIPADLQAALRADPKANEVWNDITPMARWDWIRWIGATKQPATRQRRVEVTCSKMNSGKRRPCCFNRTECTDPSLSKNGVLFDD
ncbi:YdeI/OmpD-associated family protein [soil metagenome]